MHVGPKDVACCDEGLGLLIIGRTVGASLYLGIRCLQPLSILSWHATISPSHPLAGDTYNQHRTLHAFAAGTSGSMYYKRRTRAKEPITARIQHELRPHVAPKSCTTNTSPGPIVPLARGLVTRGILIERTPVVERTCRRMWLLGTAGYWFISERRWGLWGGVHMHWFGALLVGSR